MVGIKLLVAGLIVLSPTAEPVNSIPNGVLSSSGPTVMPSNLTQDASTTATDDTIRQAQLLIQKERLEIETQLLSLLEKKVNQFDMTLIPAAAGIVVSLVTICVAYRIGKRSNRISLRSMKWESRLTNKSNAIAERATTIQEVLATPFVSAMASLAGENCKMQPDGQKIQIVLTIKNHSPHLFVIGYVTVGARIEGVMYPVGTGEDLAGKIEWPLIPSQETTSWFHIDDVLEKAGNLTRQKMKEKQKEQKRYNGLFEICTQTRWVDQLKNEGTSPKLWWSFDFEKRRLIFMPTGVKKTDSVSNGD